MTAPDPELEVVVLRHALFVPAAVRLPRASTPHPSVHEERRADDSSPPQAAAHAEGFQRGHDEGLRSGREEGLRAGYEEGLRRGQDAAREESHAAVEKAVQDARAPIEESARRMEALLSTMASAAQDAWAGADDDVLALCYETLCRVVGEAVCSPEFVLPQVERLLAASDVKGDVTLHLHPADVRLLDDARAEGWLLQTQSLRLSWRADPRVVLGGCMLAGTGGGIDARLETVLEQCKAGLLQARALRAAARAEREVAP